MFYTKKLLLAQSAFSFTFPPVILWNNSLSVSGTMNIAPHPMVIL